MDTSLVLEVSIKLGLAVLLGGLIGFERELSKHPAGLRTHILVSLGATTFMLLGYYAVEFIGDPSSVIDPTRMAAGIVTGIGFLGAGAIMKEGVNVKGLTTAATIWVTASIGLCIASELYPAAIVTTILTLLVLVIFSKIEAKMGLKDGRGTLNIVSEPKNDLAVSVLKDLKKLKLNIEYQQVKRDRGKLLLTYQLFLKPGTSSEDLIRILSKNKDLENIEWFESD